MAARTLLWRGLDAPSNLHGVSVTDSTINIAWIDDNGDFDGFRVHLATFENVHSLIQVAASDKSWPLFEGQSMKLLLGGLFVPSAREQNIADNGKDHQHQHDEGQIEDGGNAAGRG